MDLLHPTRWQKHFRRPERDVAPDLASASLRGRVESRRQEFLLRLSALSRELGVTIEGCGCCGSPFLAELPAGEAGAAGHAPIVFDREAREYLIRLR